MTSWEPFWNLLWDQSPQPPPNIDLEMEPWTSKWSLGPRNRAQEIEMNPWPSKWSPGPRNGSGSKSVVPDLIFNLIFRGRWPFEGGGPKRTTAGSTRLGAQRQDQPGSPSKLGARNGALDLEMEPWTSKWSLDVQMKP